MIYCTHQHVLSGIDNIEQYKYKAGALKKINDDLSKKNLTDDLVAAILCMISHEVSLLRLLLQCILMIMSRQSKVACIM